MKKQTRNILIGVSSAVAGAAAIGTAIYMTTKHLVKIALEREIVTDEDTSKITHKVSGTKIDDDVYQQMTDAAIDLIEKVNETIEIESYDGVHLIGHWYPCENAKRTIIAMHGWRSSWTKDFAIISEFWHNQGCNILFAEQRGQGNSGGNYMGFGLAERYDCLEWVKWINANKDDKLPIYLCGLSMGATTVLMASSLDMPSNVHGIMADCGFTSPHEIWKHVAENNLHLTYGLIGEIADDICKRTIQMGTKEYSTTEALKENKIPVFFAHGTDDKFVPIEMTYENFKICNSPKRLLVVPGATHGMSYIVDKPAYQKAVVSFWKEFDKRKVETE